MPLFQITNKRIKQIKKSSFVSERALQDIFESNLETLLGVRLVASEFATGEKHGGRIDTLGLDENDRPTIVEYKWHEKENIINQGLFYLDWLFDHRGDFEIAAQKKLGKDVEVHWDSPRLVLIAESFSKYDAYAINRIGENVELKNYRLYEDGFLILEDFQVAVEADEANSSSKAEIKREKASREKRASNYSVEKLLAGKEASIVLLFNQLRAEIKQLGENIEETPLKLYVAYKTSRNFCEVEIRAKQLKAWLDISHDELKDPRKIARDFSHVGHWGTGSTQVLIHSVKEVEYVVSLIRQSYERTL